MCKGELEKLGELYRMGVRMITLTWNFDNEIGHPNFDGFLRERLEEAGERLRKCTPGTEGWEQQRLAVQTARDACMHTPNVTGGLTPRGREFVEEMERLGIIPDVSHRTSTPPTLAMCSAWRTTAAMVPGFSCPTGSCWAVCINGGNGFMKIHKII